jgi:hypothetical protein
MAYSRQTHKRTVHCSYCHERGHNKSSCPEYAERIERLRGANGDDHYLVAAFDRKKAKRSSKAKDRKCSYCDGKGHNRATCPELRAHILESQAKTAAFRKVMLERMKALGIGVGTVLSTDRFRARLVPDDYESEMYRIPHVITLINWDLIGHWNREYSYFDGNAPWISKPLCDISANWNSEPGWIWDVEMLSLIVGEETTKQYADGTHWRAENKMNYFCDVECPVPTPEPPAKWLLGGDLKYWKALYKKRQAYSGAI